MESERKFKGLIGRIAWDIPTGDWDEAEPFFHYLTAVVLVAPLIALGITAVVSPLLSESAFWTIFVILLVVSEVLCVTIIGKAARLAETEEFVTYKLQMERWIESQKAAKK